MRSFIPTFRETAEDSGRIVSVYSSLFMTNNGERRTSDDPAPAAICLSFIVSAPGILADVLGYEISFNHVPDEKCHMLPCQTSYP